MDILINTTPHTIVLYKNGKPWKEFLPSKDHQLRLKSEPTTEFELDGFPVISAPQFTDVDGEMPLGPILVSMLVGNFLADKRRNVYGPDTRPASVVRDEMDQIIGTKRLIKYSTI